MIVLLVMSCMIFGLKRGRRDEKVVGRGVLRCSGDQEVFCNSNDNE